MESVFGEVVVVSVGLARFSLPTVFVQHYDRGSGCFFFIILHHLFPSLFFLHQLQSFFSVSDVTVERSAPA
jgi:hypothetical protein